MAAGSCVRSTGAGGSLLLSDGSRARLGRDTELRLRGDEKRGLELVRGALELEVVPGSSPCTVRVGEQQTSSQRGKFQLERLSEGVSLQVLQGDAVLNDASGRTTTVRSGERLRSDARGLSIEAIGSGNATSAFAEGLPDETAPHEAPSGLGQLSARKPGSRDERTGAVRLVAHSVRVRIAGAMARTEIEETFANQSDEVLEGIYRFPLPPEAQIEKLSLEVDGRWMDGAFVDRSRAAAIWKGAIVHAAPQAKPLLGDDIVWVPGPWRDPALLEWQRGGRFELRIFPIPRRGERRISLAYTERVAPLGASRRYTYPLASDREGQLRVERFDVSVQVRGQDHEQPVRVTGYPLSEQAIDGGRELRYSARDFVPAGALGVEYALENPQAELRGWAYDPGATVARLPGSANDVRADDDENAAYVAIALRPNLPRAAEGRPRTLALVVDSSHSMLGESYARAQALAERLVLETNADDQVVLFACSTSCRESEQRPAPGAAGAELTRRFYASQRAAGASDPTRALQLAHAAAGRASQREVELVYLGDGAPTVGPIRPSHIEAELSRLPAETARVTAVGVGAEADMSTLRALARGGGGVALRYSPGEGLNQAARAVLGATQGRALRNVEVTLPDGLYATAPAALDAIPAGGERWIVARASRSTLSGDVVLRGQLGLQRFEQRYPLRLVAERANASAFVPRLYAAERIADLERDGSSDAVRAAVRLSMRFNVASRHTSLLVLESEAMFQAFGLERNTQAPSWNADAVASGELASEGSPSSRPLEPEADEGFAENKRSGSGSGLGAAEWAQPPSAQAPAPAKARAESAAEMGPNDAALARRRSADVLELEPRPSRPAPRRMVPMRRIWERVADIRETNLTPKSANFDAIANAERQSLLDPNRREPVRKLYTLLSQAGSLARADRLVAQWTERDPLDPDALTARADLLARAGERQQAIEALGSVVDARPGDVSAQRRLERLLRWSGQAALGCRYLVAAAELRAEDVALLVDAVRCSRDANDRLQEEQLWLGASAEVRNQAEARLRSPARDDSVLSGDLRIEATWDGGEDLDIGVVDGDGLRASFLGAPTRAVISARDVTARDREGLALRGAKPGEFVIEVVRAEQSLRTLRGTLRITAAGATLSVPFVLSGPSQAVALVNLRMTPRLVPVAPGEPLR